MIEQPIEIERKFLIENEAWKTLPHTKLYIRQGYLKDNTGRRVRTVEKENGEKTGIITIKTDIDGKALTLERFSKEISELTQHKFAQDFMTQWLSRWPTNYSAPDSLQFQDKTQSLSLMWHTLSHKATFSFDISANMCAFVVQNLSSQEEKRYQGALHSEKDWSKFLKFAKLYAPRPLGKKEVEYTIDLNEAQNYLNQMDAVLEKTRFVIETEHNYQLEIDEYTNLSFPLTTLEIELKSETQKVVLPDWVGLEVSYDNTYKNSQLINSVVKKTSFKPH